MAQATFSVRMDEDLKTNFESLCKEFGMNISSAINVFARTVVRQKCIPFEISADPFYSENNISYLEKKLKDYKSGKLKFKKHELIEG